MTFSYVTDGCGSPYPTRKTIYLKIDMNPDFPSDDGMSRNKEIDKHGNHYHLSRIVFHG